MRFSLLWLKQFLNINSSANEISDTLVSLGLEVEDVIDRSHDLKPFLIAQIIEAEQHPNADKLKVCKVDSGKEILQIVCGAPNARPGIKVVLAQIGSIIPKGKFEIKKTTIRGVESHGMLCSSEELLIGSDNDGIIELDHNAVVGNSYIQHAKLDDPIFDVSITPNRGDCWSVYGIARELYAKSFFKDENKPHPSNLLCKDFTQLCQELSETQCLHSNDIDPQLKSTLIHTEKCIGVNFIKITGIRNTESPSWLKDLLKKAGMKSISAIVDITNYVAHSLGQPLHAYDSAKINGELKVQELKDFLKFNALDKNTYDLEKGDIVITDNSHVLSLAGIIGSESSACDMGTSEIIIESAIFDRTQIFKTGSRLNIHTDARSRFERGVDPKMTKEALNLAANLIMHYCSQDNKAKIEYCYTSIHKENDKILIAESKFISKRLGINISSKDMERILQGLGFEIIDKQQTEEDCKITLKVPSWRHDIEIPEDISEEIARVYGYDNITTKHSISQAPNPRAMSQLIKSAQSSKRVLAAIGYNELVNYSFVDIEEAKLFGNIIPELELANPISSNMNYMRSTILHSLCNIVSKNEQRSFNDLWLFEVGPIFRGIKENDEFTSIGALKTVVKQNMYHNKSGTPSFFDVKGDLENLLQHLKCQGYYIKPGAVSYYHPYKSASVILGKETLGYIGYIHPSVLKQLNIKLDIIGFELYLNKLPEKKLMHGRRKSYEISDYPIVKRDFAFIIDKSKSIGKVIEDLKNSDVKIKNVELFDIYQTTNPQEENNKQSVAIRVYMQDHTKTMTEDEISKLSDDIIAIIEKHGKFRLT